MTMSFSSVRPMIICGRESSKSLPAKFDDSTTSLPYCAGAVSAATVAALATGRPCASSPATATIVRPGLPTSCVPAGSIPDEAAPGAAGVAAAAGGAATATIGAVAAVAGTSAPATSVAPPAPTVSMRSIGMVRASSTCSTASAFRYSL